MYTHTYEVHQEAAPDAAGDGHDRAADEHLPYYIG